MARRKEDTIKRFVRAIKGEESQPNGDENENPSIIVDPNDYPITEDK